MDNVNREAEFRAELAGLDDAGRIRVLRKAEDLLRETRGLDAGHEVESCQFEANSGGAKKIHD